MCGTGTACEKIPTATLRVSSMAYCQQRLWCIVPSHLTLASKQYSVRSGEVYLWSFPYTPNVRKWRRRPTQTIVICVPVFSRSNTNHHVNKLFLYFYDRFISLGIYKLLYITSECRCQLQVGRSSECSLFSHLDRRVRAFVIYSQYLFKQHFPCLTCLNKEEKL